MARGHQRREAHYAAVALADWFIEDGSPHRAMELLLQCVRKNRARRGVGLLPGRPMPSRKRWSISAHARLTGCTRSPKIRAVAFDAPGERLVTLGQSAS
ncbi:MAG: hypothetical protein M5U12_12700 [Verrucomicrobia bacterium]|nr:hypothetical protein [Verrucomicrobiota bacterium]